MPCALMIKLNSLLQRPLFSFPCEVFQQRDVASWCPFIKTADSPQFGID